MHGQSPYACLWKRNFKLAIVLTRASSQGKAFICCPSCLWPHSTGLCPLLSLPWWCWPGCSSFLPTLHSPVHSQTVRTTHGLSRLHHCSTPQTWPSLPGPSPPCEQSNIFLKFREENGAESWILVSLCNLYLWVCHQTIIIFQSYKIYKY